MNYYELDRKRNVFGSLLFIVLILTVATSLSIGSYNLSINDVFSGNTIFWNIRLPRVLTAMLVGASLAVSGAVMQCVLRNPLASSFTLGISHGAAFGAAFAIIVLGAGIVHRTGEGLTIVNPYVISLFAFLGSLGSVAVILLLAKIRNLSPEAMVLAGIAMASLFSAGTMLIQYFAQNDVLVSYVVFWTFGDVGRTAWKEVFLITVSFALIFPYFILRRWDYNALLMDDETAKSLGVNPQRVRLESMLLSAFLTSVCVSFTGIIGFIGLVSPHMIRIVLGEDHRYLLPFSSLLGSLLLLLSDTFGRIAYSVIIPVGIITSFIGAPVFIYLLLRGGGR